MFLFTFTSFGVIRVLGGVGRTTIEVEVWRRATQLGDIGRAAALTVLQLCILGVTIGWAARSQRRHAHVVERSGIPELRRPRGRQRWLVAATVAGTALVIVTPLVALVERSFRVGDGYSTAAWRSLNGTAQLLPPGTVVRLERDVEARDRYDRLLAYVYPRGGRLFVNLAAGRGGVRRVARLPAQRRPPAASSTRPRPRRARGQTGLWPACGGTECADRAAGSVGP